MKQSWLARRQVGRTRGRALLRSAGGALAARMMMMRRRGRGDLTWTRSWQRRRLTAAARAAAATQSDGGGGWLQRARSPPRPPAPLPASLRALWPALMRVCVRAWCVHCWSVVLPSKLHVSSRCALGGAAARARATRAPLLCCPSCPPRFCFSPPLLCGRPLLPCWCFSQRVKAPPAPRPPAPPQRTSPPPAHLVAAHPLAPRAQPTRGQAIAGRWENPPRGPATACASGTRKATWGPCSLRPVPAWAS